MYNFYNPNTKNCYVATVQNNFMEMVGLTQAAVKGLIFIDT
jgi:hypothetical protein